MKKIKIETAEGHSSARITKFDDNDNIESHGFKKKKKKKKSKFKIQDEEISTTTDNVKEEIHISPDNIKSQETTDKNSVVSNLSSLWLNYKPRSTTLIKGGADWYEQLIKEKHEDVPIDPVTKKNLKQIAGKIFQHDVDNYKKVEERSSRKEDAKFRKTVYNVGTFRDKLAAYVLRCMDSPAHSLHHLNSIILMISPKAKNEFEEALDSVLQLLNSTLLPDNRVARKFENHQFSCLLPLLANREQAEKQLALWYFEDQLQFAYRRLISQLTQVTSDTVDKTKMVGIKSMVKLVKSHPGQDVDIILESVVNKLGDPSRKVAAQTMYSLHHLLEQRYQLKGSVVTAVEILLYRPNVTSKTQYYCLCYLKDIIFKRSDFKLAAKLVKLYIGFFKACTKKGEVDTRMMGALLRGINRAFPYSRLQGEALHEQLETLYKLCPIVNFSISTQALQLIYQVITTKSQVNQVEDRFYQALYRQIQDPCFGSSSGNTAFLNLVFKAMMRDESTERRQAFVKRLLQVAQYQTPHLMCGILFLVSEIVKEKADMKEAIQTVLQTHVDCEDPTDDFETFEDAEDEDESDVKEIETLVKESDGSDKREVEDFKEELEESKEGLIDVAEEDVECMKPLEIPVAAPVVSSWFHRSNTTVVSTIRRSHYDPYLRNPQYCGAHYSPLWELLFLQGHYHPSVSVFADKIIAGGVIDYSGDPMQDFTLMRFLDRFVYKNPKKETEQKENTAAAVLGSKAYYCPVGARGVAVNTEEFINLENDKVPEDTQFFHSYFTKFKSETKKDKDDDEDSVNDEEFDDYLSKLGGAADGSDESDVDEDLDFAAGMSATAGTATAKGGDELMGSDDDDGGASTDEEPVFGGHSDGSGDEAEFDGEKDDVDFDEENVAFSDDDDNFDSPSPAKKGSSKKQVQKKKRSKGDNLDSMFASADDFAHLLEENADEDTGLPSTTSRALANKDRAHAKQLHWEVDRNDKIKERGRYGQHRGGKNKRGQSKPFRGSGGQRNVKSKTGGPQKNFKSTRGKVSFKSKRGRRK